MEVNVSLSGSEHLGQSSKNYVVPVKGDVINTNQFYMVVKTLPSTKSEKDNFITVALLPPSSGDHPYTLAAPKGLVIKVKDGPDGKGIFSGLKGEKYEGPFDTTSELSLDTDPGPGTHRRTGNGPTSFNEGSSLTVRVRNKGRRINRPRVKLCASSTEAQASEYGFGPNLDKSVWVSFAGDYTIDDSDSRFNDSSFIPDNLFATVDLRSKTDNLLEPKESIKVKFCDGLDPYYTVPTGKGELDLDIVSTNKARFSVTWA